MYYFTKLDPVIPPPFDPSFKAYVQKLKDKKDKTDFYDFFDKFGTHYAKHMNFGAKFVYQHKMNSTSFKKEENSKFGVKVSVSLF